MNQKLSIHHIGGREGSGSLPPISQFRDDLVYTLYDADADCIEQIKERNEGKCSELHVLPFCVGAGQGKGTFYINFDPYTSSVFRLNPRFSDYSHFNGRVDCLLSEGFRPMEERSIEMVSLDHLKQTNRLTCSPDFLSID